MIWRTLLAYAIVLLFGQIVANVSILLGVPITGILLFLHPATRSQITGFIVGLLGALATILFAYYIFTWIVGVGSFIYMPFVASVIPILLHTRKAYAFYLENRIKFMETLDPEAALDYLRIQAGVAGYLAGIGLGGYLFLNHYFDGGS